MKKQSYPPQEGHELLCCSFFLFRVRIPAKWSPPVAEAHGPHRTTPMLPGRFNHRSVNFNVFGSICCILLDRVVSQSMDGRVGAGSTLGCRSRRTQPYIPINLAPTKAWTRLHPAGPSGLREAGPALRIDAVCCGSERTCRSQSASHLGHPQRPVPVMKRPSQQGCPDRLRIRRTRQLGTGRPG